MAKKEVFRRGKPKMENPHYAYYLRNIHLNLNNGNNNRINKINAKIRKSSHK